MLSQHFFRADICESHFCQLSRLGDSRGQVDSYELKVMPGLEEYEWFSLKRTRQKGEAESRYALYGIL